jgi:hypothetical protein
MAGKPRKIEVREAIAGALYPISATELPHICDGFEMPPNPEGAEGAMAGKERYVARRLIGCSLEELFGFVRQVADEYGEEGLEKYLTGDGFVGVEGELKNLIFAADGPKPDIVLVDSVNNVIKIVKNAQYCLVYDRPLGEQGLTWQMLVDWWSEREGIADKRRAATTLYKRLLRSLDDGPEKLVLRTYAKRYRPAGGFDLPALVPQVYLHYDPYTKAERGAEGKVLSRQRMDFLMLFPNGSRVVIEIDGKQHYASGVKADPALYADMVREDRGLRLCGYEIYRFGGDEFVGGGGAQAVEKFFDALLARHS